MTAEPPWARSPGVHLRVETLEAMLGALASEVRPELHCAPLTFPDGA